MKKFFYLCMLALAPMFTFVACGDDDEDNAETNGEVVYNEDGTKIMESDNQVVMTSSYEIPNVGKINVKAVANFSNDVCTTASYSETYPSADLAKMVYESLLEDLDEDEPNIYSLNGSTLTADLTADMKGESKKYVIEYFKWIAEENQMEIDDDYEVKSYNAGIRRIRK